MWIYTTKSALINSTQIGTIRHESDGRRIVAYFPGDVDGNDPTTLAHDVTPLEAEQILQGLPKWLALGKAPLDMSEVLRDLRQSGRVSAK